ncbi:MAG: hypothetical protein ABR529_15530 [Actinomycetota bacterium]
MTGSREPPGWDAPSAPAPGRAELGRALAPIVGGGIALALGAAIFVAPLAGIVVLAALGGAGWWWTNAQGRRALRSLEAARVESSGAPRLVNLAAGLAADLGIATPALWVIPEGGPNALVCRAQGRLCLGVTRSLLERYTRTELEAVIAHCLVRMARSPLVAESIAAAFPFAARPVGALVGNGEDVTAAALTRYPPALEAAIAKAEPGRRHEPFWFVAEGPWHRPREGRVRTLGDL